MLKMGEVVFAESKDNAKRRWGEIVVLGEATVLAEAFFNTEGSAVFDEVGNLGEPFLGFLFALRGDSA